MGLKEDFNPKSIAYECLRLLEGRNVPEAHSSSALSSNNAHRVVARLELATVDASVKVEEIFQALLPTPESEALRAHFALLGENICISRDPKCSACPLHSLCPSASA